MTVRVGFTGTQVGMTDRQRERIWAFVRHREFIAHHGDCIGADAEFDRACRVAHWCRGIVIHPPTDPTKRAFCAVRERVDELRPERPYLDRNQDIVDACDLLVVSPKEMREVARSGTWSTFRRAREAGKPFVLMLPDGAVVPSDASVLEKGLVA